MKRTLSFLAISALSTAALAGNAGTPALFNGFYMGAGIAAEAIHTESQSEQILNQNVQSNESGDFSYNAAAPQIQAGYGHQFGNIYLGANVLYRYTGTQGRGLSTDDSIDAQNPYGIDHTILPSLRFGFVATPRLMFYLLAGVNFSHLHGYVIPSETSSVERHHYDDWIRGITPGAGFEYLITNHLSIDANYTYTAFQQALNTITVTSLSPSPSVHFEHKITTSVFGLSLNYHFA